MELDAKGIVVMAALALSGGCDALERITGGERDAAAEAQGQAKPGPSPTGDALFGVDNVVLTDRGVGDWNRLELSADITTLVRTEREEAWKDHKAYVKASCWVDGDVFIDVQFVGQAGEGPPAPGETNPRMRPDGGDGCERDGRRRSARAILPGGSTRRAGPLPL